MLAELRSVAFCARAAIPRSSGEKNTMSGNLRRYALWQFRDFGRDRAIALLIIGFALGFTFVAPDKR